MSGQPGTNRSNAPPPRFCPSPTKVRRMLMAQSSSPPQASETVVDVDVSVPSDESEREDSGYVPRSSVVLMPDGNLASLQRALCPAGVGALGFLAASVALGKLHTWIGYRLCLVVDDDKAEGDAHRLSSVGREVVRVLRPVEAALTQSAQSGSLGGAHCGDCAAQGGGQGMGRCQVF